MCPTYGGGACGGDVLLMIMIMMTMSTRQIGKAVIASSLSLDAPKHIFLMLFMLVDRQDSASFFKVPSFRRYSSVYGRYSSMCMEAQLWYAPPSHSAWIVIDCW
jgi:hypothetical protein